MNWAYQKMPKEKNCLAMNYLVWHGLQIRASGGYYLKNKIHCYLYTSIH